MTLPALTFTKDTLTQFNEVITKEWLITNGLGGYASSTVPGINTRKYHGLLVAALNPPGNRTVCLAKLDEDVHVGNSVFRLGSNEFHDMIFPEGYRLIEQFTLAPFPTYTYNIGDVRVSKTVFLPTGKNAVAITYTVANHAAAPAKVRLYPMLTCRYFHNVLDHHRVALNFTLKNSSKECAATFQHPQATVVCRATDGEFKEGLNWVERLHFRDETLRGEADTDDCFQPGYFEVQVPAGTEKMFAVTAAANYQAAEAEQVLDSVGSTAQDVNALLTRELYQRDELLANLYRDQPAVPQSDWLNWILLAADSFMVENAVGRKAVIAGYFWFEPWGRDTFISLPGLMLVTRRYTEAKDILANFIGYCRNGLIPNFVTDKTGAPVYNTVDGTLWYVNAVLQYLKYTGDYTFVQTELWEKLQSIVENHRKGTLFGIRLDSDGLLLHGPSLTWMDAVVAGEMITPRAGKAVEIQALWYNTLRIMELLAAKFHDAGLAETYAGMAAQTARSFNEKFWNPERGCLYDALGSSGADASMRPNQIFAVSLDYTMLDHEKSVKVVDSVKQELVTPYGLRTLSMDDPKFVGKYIGDHRSRDTAYHNGTIWPWLLGPYVTAYLKAHDYTQMARQQAFKELILPLFSVGIHQGGLGTINEIYDCDPPNIPRGCIAQAWSVAEPLRAYVEDVLLVKPKNAETVMAPVP